MGVQAMEAASRKCIRHAESNAVQALAALAHPSWTPAVVGAAAAIAADSAAAVCARCLITEVTDPCNFACNAVAFVLSRRTDVAYS